MSEIKFNERWKEHLAHYKESARRMYGELIQFIFHIFSWQQHERDGALNREWIRQGEGEDGQKFTPETCPHQVIFMGKVNGIPLSSKELKGGCAQFLQDAERNAAYFGKFKPGYFMYIGPSSQETWTFHKVPKQPKRKVG